VPQDPPLGSPALNPDQLALPVPAAEEARNAAFLVLRCVLVYSLCDACGKIRPDRSGQSHQM